MRLNQILRPVFLPILLALLLFSCERLADREADYRYKIENATTSTVEVVVTIKQNPSVVVQGDPNRYYTLAPGGTAEVWASSGFTNEEVYDEERKNKVIYWISVTATSNGRQAVSNLNSTGRWRYSKEGRYKATYTLSLAQDDF